jgi:2-oxoglutarate dehydrogenase E2 component (dihydrolipoamide succinyltransferase)
MALDIKVPVLPESVADATVLTWHKKPGDAVKRDENLVDIETDKVVLEVVAPSDGVLATIIKDVGAIVKAEEIIGTFTSQSIATQQPASPQQTTASPQQPTAAPQSTPVPISMDSTSPSERRALKEQDVIINNNKNTSIAKEATTASRLEKRVPMTRLRSKIAERLLEAQQNSAILTTFNEVNMAPVIALRSNYKEEFLQKYGVRLGFMSFFVLAVVAALKKFPTVNASIDGNDIVYHGFFDIGIAVSTDRGLVVPVLRDADTLTMAEIEQKITQFGKDAKENKLTMEDLSGGTFTITNGGVYGSLMSTPILNPPQSGILGVHKIEERPVVEDKQIVIRPMMYVALSYDHRIIDGAESVQFLVAVKELLEDPARLLLSI